MVKRRQEDIPALVLVVLARVHELSQDRHPPWYVNHADLDLVHPSDRVDAAIYYAAVSGWLANSGEPPRSSTITPAGIQLLADRGMI